MIKQKKTVLIFSFLMLVILVSCQPSGITAESKKPDGSSNNFLATRTESSSVQTQSQLVEKTDLPLLTPEISNTREITIVQTIEPPQNELMTFIPEIINELFLEIPDSDNGEKIQYLLDTNGGCKFPCLWGFIIPGQTEWESAENVIDSFVNDYNYELIFDNDVDKEYVLLDSEDIYLGGLYISVENNLITSFGITNIKNYFSISRILEKYGKPQGVYLYSAKISNIDGSLSFYLILDYCDENFHITYYEPKLSQKRMDAGKVWWEYVPNSVGSVHYTELKPELYLLNLEIYQGRHFYPLSEITGMDVDAFYNHFMSGMKP